MKKCLKCKKDTSNPKFCSLSCCISYNNKKRFSEARKNRVCIVCGKQREAWAKKYCSHSCAASKTNKMRKKKKPVCKRPECKKEVAKRGNTYCSNSCCAKNRRWRNIEKWISNPETMKKFPSNKDSAIRNWFFDYRGRICSECGTGEIYNNKELVLEVDHIDGDYRNNFLENLRLLCPNCHSQTETYKSKNRNTSTEKRNRVKYKNRKNHASLV